MSKQIHPDSITCKGADWAAPHQRTRGLCPRVRLNPVIG
jgi:hypothetical protein